MSAKAGGRAVPSPGAAAPGRRRRARALRTWLGLLPFLAYLACFFVVPSAAVVTAAFENGRGGFTWSNLTASLSGIYLTSYGTSLELAAISSIVAAVAGTLVTIAVVSSDRPLLHRLVTTGAGVMANTGGLPLAFAFIAAIGNFGIVTQMLSGIGFNPYDHGFTLYSFTGLVIVYLYFLIPVMVLVMLPAVQALRREWFEAASILGAGRRQCWRLVGVPILAPAFLAGLMVLFTDAFAAYVTADVMTQGTIPLVPIQIGSLIQGNVLAGQQNLGDALGLGMISVVVAAGVAYALVQRRAARWQR